MTTPTSQDARESALERVVYSYNTQGAQVRRVSSDDAMEARAELSALRASQGAVAREFVEAADRLRGAAQDPEHSCAPPWDRVIAYDRARHALRPAATGEAISADDLRDAFIEGWHASSEELDEPYDAKKALAAWGESASKHDARAAIARAEGRKGQ